MHFPHNIHSGIGFFREWMPAMINNSSAELREWAARCEDGAASTSDDNERASLLRKCEALRALADQEDWLAGRSSDHAQPANDATFAAADRRQTAE